MKIRVFFLTFFLLSLTAVFPESVFADPAYIVKGIGTVLLSVLQIPRYMLTDSVQMGPLFPVGLITGAVKGSVAMLTGTLAGATDIARGAAPFAKYLMFLI